jgi:hypothetical protein
MANKPSKLMGMDMVSIDIPKRMDDVLNIMAVDTDMPKAKIVTRLVTGLWYRVEMVKRSYDIGLWGALMTS